MVANATYDEKKKRWLALDTCEMFRAINVHFHMLALDGVYAENDDGFLRFHEAGSPSDDEVRKVAKHISRRVEKLMLRQGLISGAFGDFSPDRLSVYGGSWGLLRKENLTQTASVNFCAK